MKTSLCLLGVFAASILTGESHDCTCSNTAARVTAAVTSTPSTEKSAAPQPREQKPPLAPAGKERQRDGRRPRPEYLFL
jgi:hypothetical protein